MTNTNVFDLSPYPCPMNLVMAKNHFYELKNGENATFKLNKTNQAGINNIQNFLSSRSVECKLQEGDGHTVLILFTKPVKKPVTTSKKSDKKTALAKQLQQNIRRRKDVLNTN